MEIFKNDFFTLVVDNGRLYISVFQPGFVLRELNGIIERDPRIAINDFKNVANALRQANGEKIEIGFYKPRVSVTVSADRMQATIKLNVPDEELQSNPDAVRSEILEALEASGVTEGILTDVLINGLRTKTEIAVARGIPPVHGEDAQIRYLQPSEKKPKILSDGRVDLYELNFIDQVKQGDWLGEKIPPTEGIPGRTVTGAILPAKRGGDRQLKYDPKSVVEVQENGKVVLKALFDGALEFKNGKISVIEHYIIDGDVGTKTGNIEYKGYVTVKGTVQDGFSVVAEKDICVLSEMGIGAVDKIVSLSGNIFIKGGIFGKNKAFIQADKNVYVKHANDCTINAGGDINIGLYAIGSNLYSKNIILDKYRGKIIGGETHAEAKVIAAYIGNENERPTPINVQGFDRADIHKQLNELLEEYKGSLSEIEGIKRELEVYESVRNKLSEADLEEYFFYVKKHDEMLDKLYELETRRKSLMALLETRGEGEVSIVQRAFPQTLLRIKNSQKRIDKITAGTFYVRDHQLLFE